MGRYIPGTRLPVADRPQPSVNPGAGAPGFLSRLRRLRVGTNSVPLRPPDSGHSLHAVAPPFPTQPASLGLRRDPFMLGEKNLSPRPLLAVTIFLFLRCAPNPLYVVFCREQFYHLFPLLLVLWIPLFVFRLQLSIFLFRRLHRRQFLQTEGIKVPLRRLTRRDFAAMLFIKFLPFPAPSKRNHLVLCSFVL